MSDFYEDMGCEDIDEFLILYDDGYYDSDSESGVLLSDKELIEVEYQKDSHSSAWTMYLGQGYPIIKKDGNIITAKDPNTENLFKVRVTRDRTWKKTEDGLPVKIEVIK